MEWLIFIVVCWVAVRFLAPGRCGEGRRTGHRVRPARSSRPLPAAPPPAKPETAEQRLRRQYVEGTMSVEQYERELDRLYRSQG